MEYYRIYREKDGKCDGDYVSFDVAKEALAVWKWRYPKDKFTIQAVVKNPNFWKQTSESNKILL